jgi:hypothetical protein
MALSCAWMEREFEMSYIGHLVLLPFSGLAEHLGYEVGLLYQYRVQLNYVLRLPLICVKDINMTVNEIDA